MRNRIIKTTSCLMAVILIISSPIVSLADGVGDKNNSGSGSKTN